MAKVLVVDDSVIVLEWVSRVLKEAGHEVLTREFSLGTGAAVIRERPDLLLLDVDMPSLKGPELVASVRKNEHMAFCLTALFSSMPLYELQRRAKDCGAHGYVRKTSDAQDFVSQVERILRLSVRKLPD